MFKNLKNLNIQEKIYISISFAIRASLLFAIIMQILSSRWPLVFVTSFTLILTFIPALLQKNFKITLPTEVELYAFVFIFMTMFLGEEKGYYYRFDWWDNVLHFSSAFVFGFLGFLIVYVLYIHKKVLMKPIFIALFIFCFTLAIGAVWEIFEFSMDQSLGLNMQRARESGVVDTMTDIIFDSLGGLVAAILGFIYVKESKGFIIKRWIDEFVKKNPRFFKKSIAKRTKKIK